MTKRQSRKLSKILGLTVAMMAMLTVSLVSTVAVASPAAASTDFGNSGTTFDGTPPPGSTNFGGCSFYISTLRWGCAYVNVLSSGCLKVTAWQEHWWGSEVEGSWWTGTFC